MNHRIENVKQHLRNNKVTYIACSVTAVVCVAGTYFLVSKPEIHAGVRIQQFLPWKSTNNIEVNNFIEITAPMPRGKRGSLIECLTNGEWYGSQKRAAEATGISRTALRKHLEGKLDDVNGLTFKDHGEYLAPTVAA